MNNNTHPRLLIAAVALALVAGCTPGGATAGPTTPSLAPTTSPTPTATPTVSPSSPTPTTSATADWNTEQTKAVAAVKGYLRLTDKYLADPNGTSIRIIADDLYKYISGDMLTANIKMFVKLQKTGEHSKGTITTVWIKPAKARDSKGRLWVNVCRDATSHVWVYKDGTTQQGGMSLRQFSVRPGDGKHWKIYGEKAGEGTCE